MAQASETDDEITGINVTPLVDVMLVLLIIFMVTANYIAQNAINLQLPKAATGADTATTNLAFSLDKNGQLFLNGKPLVFSELAGAVAAEKAKGHTLQALIAADEATPHGLVVKLIDAIRKNGITDFAINVEVESR
jgi:biopolymer transport protein ExbD